MAFANNIHILNWNYTRVRGQPGLYSQRLRWIGEDLRQRIHHIAVHMSPNSTAEMLQPFFLLCAAVSRPLHTLEQLTIIFDRPRITTNYKRAERIRAENRACYFAFHMKRVNKVIIQNILYRDDNSFRARLPGQDWHFLGLRADSGPLTMCHIHCNIRYQLVLTRFASSITTIS